MRVPDWLGLLAGSAFSALALGLVLPSAVFASDFAPPSASVATAASAVLPEARSHAAADFGGETASADARRVADWRPVGRQS